jgi:feruloyl esterase
MAGLALLVAACAGNAEAPPSRRLAARGDACAALAAFADRGVRVVAATAVSPKPSPDAAPTMPSTRLSMPLIA